MKHLLAILLIIPFLSFGQTKFYEEAEKLFAQEKYYAAIDLYKGASHVPKEIRWDPLYKIGYSYKQIFDYRQAEHNFEKAVRARCPQLARAYMYLADCKKWMGKYAEAIVSDSNYRVLVPVSRHDFKKSCITAQDWLANPTKYKVENVRWLNTKEWETSVSFANTSYRSLYIGSARVDSVPWKRIGQLKPYSGQAGEAVFQSHQTDTGWSTPLWVNWYFTGSYRDQAVAYSPGIGKVYISQALQFGKKRNRYFKYKLLAFSPNATSIEQVEKFSFCYGDTAEFNYVTPYAISPGQILFSSDRLGGFGGYDLWIVNYDSLQKKWGKPENLGPDVNTYANEQFPFLRSDGTLYFASDDHMGMGGFDIYKASPAGKNKWTKPENMMYPINTSQDDWGIIFEGNKEKGYLISNRLGGKGGFDIYSFIYQQE